MEWHAFAFVYASRTFSSISNLWKKSSFYIFSVIIKFDISSVSVMSFLIMQMHVFAER